MPGKTILLLLVLTSSRWYSAVTDTDRISMHSRITRQRLRFVRLVVVLHQPPRVSLFYRKRLSDFAAYLHTCT